MSAASAGLVAGRGRVRARAIALLMRASANPCSSTRSRRTASSSTGPNGGSGTSIETGCRKISAVSSHSARSSPTRSTLGSEAQVLLGELERLLGAVSVGPLVEVGTDQDSHEDQLLPEIPSRASSSSRSMIWAPGAEPPRFFERRAPGRAVALRTAGCRSLPKRPPRPIHGRP